MSQLTGSRTWKPTPMPTLTAGMIGAVVGGALALTVALAGPAVLDRIEQRTAPVTTKVEIPIDFVAQQQAQLQREYGASVDVASALQRHIAREYKSPSSSSTGFSSALQGHVALEYGSVPGVAAGGSTRDVMFEHTLRENGA